MRNRAGYWIGAGLVAIGIVGAIAWVLQNGAHVLRTVADFQHVAIPGHADVRLESRKYVIYVEGPGADENVPPIDLFVTHARTETRIPVARYNGSLTYEFDSAGSAVGTVTTPVAGVYRVRTDGPRGYRLAIGESIGSALVRTIVGALVIGAVFCLGGITLLILTAVRRSRAAV